jgi:hypothetical protein
MEDQRIRKRSFRRHIAIGIALIVPAVVLMAACGGDPLNTGTSSGSSLAPTIVSPPANLTVTAGQAARFMVSASGSAPLSYQWRRDNVEIPGATQSTYTLDSPGPSDNGATFAVRVSNSFGSVTSGTATLTVQ